MGESPLYNHCGDDSVEDPPVPIPNTEVKLNCAESTWLATAREDKELPHSIFLVSSAVERPYRFTPETDGYMKCKSSKGIQVLTTLKKRQIFLVSSAVEHPAVNRRVVGSNPTRGAIFHSAKSCQWIKKRDLFKSRLFYCQKSHILCVYS